MVYSWHFNHDQTAMDLQRDYLYLNPNGKDHDLYMGFTLTSSTPKSGFSWAFDPFPEISFPSYKFHFKLLLWGPSEPLFDNFLSAESAIRSPGSMESLVTLPLSDIFSKSAWPIWCFSISSLKIPLTGLWTFRFGSYIYKKEKTKRKIYIYKKALPSKC